MSVNFEFKENYTFDDLVEIVKLLRSPGGCPWDMEQNHKSIREDFLEETYEVLEAIDTDNKVLLEEELGDVLLQVVFHCRIETENGNFVFDDVCDEVCKKLIVRHPHVFGDVIVADTSDVLKNWDSIKKETKGQESYTDTLKSVAKSLPALMRAQKVGKRAMRAGMDFRTVDDAVACIAAEKAEFDKKRIVAQGQAEAEANRLKVQAGLTPQERAEWDYKTAVGVAEALANSKVRWVPEIMMGNSGNSSAMDAVGFNMMMDIVGKINNKK